MQHKCLDFLAKIFLLSFFFSFHLSGVTTRRFTGHTKDVLSVAFSADNRQIVSGSRDKTIKLWNTLGVCKYTITVLIHAEVFYQLMLKDWEDNKL